MQAFDGKCVYDVYQVETLPQSQVLPKRSQCSRPCFEPLLT